jgi:hypothetical protein
MGGVMKYRRVAGIILLLLVMVSAAGCKSISREDFEVSGDAACITWSMDYFPSYFLLAWVIADHVVSGMKVVEKDQNLRGLKVVIFTFTGELEDKYGNKWNDIWTRVVVPVKDWQKYSKEITHDTYRVRNRLLYDWIADGFPHSAGLRKELSGK